MPTNSPNQPVAIITGAGSGIGSAIALALAGLGWRTALVGRRHAPLEEVAGQAPEGNTLIVPADIADSAQAPQIVDKTIKQFGRIDALINNAGLAYLRDIEDSGAETLNAMFAINAIGPGALIASVWPIMKRQRTGVIINISTMSTQDPFPGLFAYAGSKAALEVYAKSVAIEGAAHNIRGFSIAPGAVETEMLRGIVDNETLPTSATLAPDDIAIIAVECIQGARDSANGQTILAPSPAPAG